MLRFSVRINHSSTMRKGLMAAIDGTHKIFIFKLSFWMAIFLFLRVERYHRGRLHRWLRLNMLSHVFNGYAFIFQYFLAFLWSFLLANLSPLIFFLFFYFFLLFVLTFRFFAFFDLLTRDNLFFYLFIFFRFDFILLNFLCFRLQFFYHLIINILKNILIKTDITDY